MTASSGAKEMAVRWRHLLAAGLLALAIAGPGHRVGAMPAEVPPEIDAMPAPGEFPLGPPIANEDWADLPPAPAASVDPLPRLLSAPPGMPPGARYLLDPRTGLPRLLYDLNDRPRGRDPRAAAESFLREHRALLLGGGNLADLAYVQTDARPGSGHVQYEQRHAGAPVWGGGLTVHLDADGRVLMVNGSFFPRVRLGAAIRLPAEEAIRRALAEVGDEAPLLAEPEVVLGVYPRLRVFRPAYRVRLTTAAPADWQCYVDAGTGAVLEANNRGREVEGSGLVVEENPAVTPSVVSRPFLYLDGSGYLRGQFADVWIFDRYERGSYLRRKGAYSATNTFEASTDAPQFDEQMLYYHVTRVHDWFKSRFGFTRRDSPLAVHAHWPTIGSNGQVQPYNNAYFSPGSQGLYFGDGTGTARGGLNSLARDADVIYHEYGHAVVDRITDLGRWSHDFGTALNEAYADYFSATITGNPTEGEYASGRPSGIRSLAAANRFPHHVNHPSWGLPEAHYTGIIWGATSWDVRERLGAEIADRVLFEALYFFPRDGSADFPIALAAVLQADKALYNGEHQTAIREAFAARGIHEPQRGYEAGEAITFAPGGRLASLAFASFDRVLLLSEDNGPEGVPNSYVLNDLRFNRSARTTTPRRLTLFGTGSGRSVAYDPVNQRAVVGDKGGSYKFVALIRGSVTGGGEFGADVQSVAVQPLVGKVYFGVGSPGRLEALTGSRRLTPLVPTPRVDPTRLTIRDVAADLTRNQIVLAVDDSAPSEAGQDRLEVRDSRVSGAPLRSEWLASGLGIADVGQLALEERQGLAFVVDNAPNAASRSLVIVDLRNGVPVDRIDLGPARVTDLAYDPEVGVAVVAQAGPGGYTLVDVAARRAVAVSLDADVTAVQFEPLTHTAALSTLDGRLILIPFVRSMP
jgi:Zn-dependent metalloprotease